MLILLPLSIFHINENHTTGSVRPYEITSPKGRFSEADATDRGTDDHGKRDDTVGILGKVESAYRVRDSYASRLSLLDANPAQLPGGNLEYSNHSSDYTFGSGGSAFVSHKMININGSLEIDSGTELIIENSTIHFNFAGSDPYITLTGQSSLTLLNVTVDSDIPLRLYSLESNLTFMNSYVAELQGEDIILSSFILNRSYISRLTDTLTLDRSTVDLSGSHINGTTTGMLSFQDSTLNVTYCAFSNLGCGLCISSSVCTIRASCFYSNVEAISSISMLGSEIDIYDIAFLRNGNDFLMNNHQISIAGCIFANTLDETMDHIGDGGIDNDQDGRDGLRDSDVPLYRLNNSIFYNVSSITFRAVPLSLLENVFYNLSAGLTFYNCQVLMDGAIFFNENMSAERNTIENSNLTLKDARFYNWYCPLTLIQTEFFITDCTFEDCNDGIELYANFDLSDWSVISHCDFLGCDSPVTVEGSDDTLHMDNVTIGDCTHGIDLFSMNMDLRDSSIITQGWNLQLRHSLVDAINVSLDYDKVFLVEDCTLFMFVRMSLIVKDFGDAPLVGLELDVQEIYGGPSYSFRTGPDGGMNIAIMNRTMEGTTTSVFDSYLFYHESEQWGYLREEVNIENGKCLTLRVGFSDLAVSDFDHSHDDPYHGMEMTSRILVYNLDLKTAEDVLVTFYLDFVKKAERRISTIQYNETVELNFTWMALQGSRYLEVHVDPFNELYESSESNNYQYDPIEVVPKPTFPVARLTVDETVIVVGGSVTLNASASKADTLEIEYRFDFGDGTVSEWLSEAVVNRIYNETGTFYLSCMIRDTYGQISDNSSVHELKVITPPPPPKKPVAIISLHDFLENITVDTLVALSPKSSYSPDNAEIVEYRWSFSDGRYDNITKEPKTISRKFDDDIRYTVSLIVKDDRGMISPPARKEIRVSNLPPVAYGRSNRTEVEEGGNVSFTSAGTTDPDDDEILELEYAWHFPGSVVISGKQVSYQFTEEGIFTVILVVTDDDMITDSIILSIVVTERDEKDGNGTGIDEQRGLIKEYWIWIVSVLGVLLIGFTFLIKARREKKRGTYRNLRLEQDNLRDEIRKKEIKRSYEEAERQIRKRIASGDKIDFTARSDEIPTYDDEVDYYGLDNVVEYDGEFGIGSAGDVVEHEMEDHEEVVFTTIEEDEEEAHWNDDMDDNGAWDGEDEEYDTDQVNEGDRPDVYDRGESGAGYADGGIHDHDSELEDYEEFEEEGPEEEYEQEEDEVADEYGDFDFQDDQEVSSEIDPDTNGAMPRYGRGDGSKPDVKETFEMDSVHEVETVTFKRRSSDRSESDDDWAWAD